jgi:PAS domain-containing protein
VVFGNVREGGDLDPVASSGLPEGDIPRVRELDSTAPSMQREERGDLADSLYRAIVATAVDGIIVIDRNGAIRSVNNATERLFGYTAAESSDETSTS